MVGLFVDDDTYVYKRDAGDGRPIMVGMSKASSDVVVTLDGVDIPAGEYRDVLSGDRMSVREGEVPKMKVRPLTGHVWVMETDPCSEVVKMSEPCEFVEDAL